METKKPIFLMSLLIGAGLVVSSLPSMGALRTLAEDESIQVKFDLSDVYTKDLKDVTPDSSGQKIIPVGTSFNINDGTYLSYKVEKGTATEAPKLRYKSDKNEYYLYLKYDSSKAVNKLGSFIQFDAKPGYLISKVYFNSVNSAPDPYYSCGTYDSSSDTYTEIVWKAGDYSGNTIEFDTPAGSARVYNKPSTDGTGDQWFVPRRYFTITLVPDVSGKFILSYDTNGGHEMSPDVYEKDEITVRPEDPVKDSTKTKQYTFAGWFKDKACTEGNEFVFGSALEENTTIYAKWNEEDKTIWSVKTDFQNEIVKHGGEEYVRFKEASLPMSLYEGGEEDENFSISFEPDSTKNQDNYLRKYNSGADTFVYMHSNQKKNFEGSHFVIAPIDGQDSYLLNSISVEDLGLSGKTSDEGPVNYRYSSDGEAYTEVLDASFSGGYFNVDNLPEGTRYFEMYCDRMTDTSTKFYLRSVSVNYSKKIEGGYTVTFDPQNGEEQFKQTVAGGKTPVQPLDPFKKSENIDNKWMAYDFDGWYDEPEGGEKYNFDTVLDDGTILYAQYVSREAQKYTMSFDTNGGSVLEDMDIYEGTVAEKPENPTKECEDPRYKWNFNNWFIDSGLSTQYHFTEIVFGDVQLYAKWDKGLADDPAGTTRFQFKNKKSADVPYNGNDPDGQPWNSLSEREVSDRDFVHYGHTDYEEVMFDVKKIDSSKTGGLGKGKIAADGTTYGYSDYDMVAGNCTITITIVDSSKVFTYFSMNFLTVFSKTSNEKVTLTVNGGDDVISEAEAYNINGACALRGEFDEEDTIKSLTITFPYVNQGSNRIQVTGLEYMHLGFGEEIISSFDIDTTECKKEFELDEDFSSEGLVATGYNPIGGEIDISDAVSVDSSDFEKGVVGEYEIIVSYGELEDQSYSVNVVDNRVLDSISLSKTKIELWDTEEFVYDGVVTAKFTNGDEVDVTDSVTFVGVSDEPGEYDVTVSYTKNGITKTAGLELVVYYSKTVLSIELDTQNVQKQFIEGDDFNSNNLIVTANYAHADSEEVSGFSVDSTKVDMETAGTYTVIVSYELAEAEYTIKVVKNHKLSGISLSISDDELWDNESFTFNGVITAHFEDGDDETLDISDVIFTGNVMTLGTHSVTVSYTRGEITKSTSYSLTVKNSKEVTSILLDIDDVKTIFYEGENFSSEGLIVTANYIHADSEEVTGYTVDSSAVKMDTAGTYQVNVEYEGKSASYSVKVIKNHRLTGISLSVSEIELWDTESFTYSGVITAHFEDEVDETIDNKDVTFTGAEMSVGTHIVTVSYTKDNVTKSAEFTLTVKKAKEVTSIELNTDAVKKQFFVGEEFTSEGLIVTAHYAHADDESVIGIVSTDDVDMSKAGTYVVNVSFGDKTASYNISVIHAHKLESIELSTTSIELWDCDAFSYTGVVTAHFEDGVDGAVDKEDLVFSGNEMTVGSHTVTVSYTYEGITKSAQFTLVVKESKAVTSISIDTTEVKKEYLTGDAFSYNGIVVTANYTHAESEVVSDYTVDSSNVDMSKPGTYTVVVNYSGQSKSYEIVVRAYADHLVLGDTKVSYNVGDQFVAPTVTVVNTDGSEYLVDELDVLITGYDMSRSGEQTVSVFYTDQYGVTVSKSYVITVNAVLVNIQVSNPKTTYEYGEEFVAPTVNATYSDGTTSTVTSATFSGYDANKSGVQTITVTYTENGVTKTCTYVVTVAPKQTKAGCGGSIIATSGILSLVALSGVVAAIAKKSKKAK